mmetsp:Transcript_37492/g.79520  ORF Transcript_37492/g.79520 Transcript_37492/m.79520 type:complete len:349 (+) Transcript_37492:820-1866(+)
MRILFSASCALLAGRPSADVVPSLDGCVVDARLLAVRASCLRRGGSGCSICHCGGRGGRRGGRSGWGQEGRGGRMHSRSRRASSSSRGGGGGCSSSGCSGGGDDSCRARARESGRRLGSGQSGRLAFFASLTTAAGVQGVGAELREVDLPTPNIAGSGLLGAAGQGDIVQVDVHILAGGPRGVASTVESRKSPVVDENVVGSVAPPLHAVHSRHFDTIKEKSGNPVRFRGRFIELNIEGHAVPSSGLQINWRTSHLGLHISPARVGSLLVIQVHDQFPIASPHGPGRESSCIDSQQSRQRARCPTCRPSPTRSRPGSTYCKSPQLASNLERSLPSAAPEESLGSLAHR